MHKIDEQEIVQANTMNFEVNDALKVFKKEVQAKARLVKKDGTLNLVHKQLIWRNPLYTENAVLLNWVTVLMLIIVTFFGSWLLFALLYWLMEEINKDAHESSHEPPKKCVEGLEDFNSALLFSVETMSSIGYGSRAPTDHCPFVIFLSIFQSLFGVLIAGILTGILRAKFMMPGIRKDFIRFSEEAVVLMRNKKLYLVVKVADQRDSKLRGVTTTAIMVDTVVTEEGEIITNNIRSIQFGNDEDRHISPYLWPACIAHEINSNSPLYHFNPDMVGESDMDFELIIWVTGTTSYGGLVNARTSYIPSEIVWGGSFEFESDFQHYGNHITVLKNSENFDTVESEELPRISAAVMEKDGIIEL